MSNAVNVRHPRNFNKREVLGKRDTDEVSISSGRCLKYLEGKCFQRNRIEKHERYRSGDKVSTSQGWHLRHFYILFHAPTFY